MGLERLGTPVHGSSLKSLWSNLRDFLMERPVKYRGGRTPEMFATFRFGGSLSDNVKGLLEAGPRGPVNSPLLVKWEEETGFWENLRDLIAPRKQAPLPTTSEPIPVPEIWSKDTALPRAQALSIAVHVIVLLVLLVFVPLLPGLMSPATTKASNITTAVDISPYLPKLAPAEKKAGGGGGQHDQAPASKGRLPKFSWTQIARPLVKPPAHPEIAVTPTVLGNPAIVMPNINAPNWGDPLGKTVNDSLGQGRGTGVGNGYGAGVGPGEGWNTGGGPPEAGIGGYGIPQCAYCPQPEYSMDAVKVKLQGVVLLAAVITADGKVTDVHVAKGLGYGLDEKAVEMARTWRLIPARGPDGKPAAVRTTIEVTFRLF